MSRYSGTGGGDPYTINPYFDWSARGFEALTQFTARLVKLRRDHPVFRRRRFFQSSRGG
ncbi:MAG TPA: hypothetical protein VF734_18755 [Pseudonocardiaceae bacterium]|jgi:pullulanase/glycogen debranching enzyme